jgi:hypothetical protein
MRHRITSFRCVEATHNMSRLSGERKTCNDVKIRQSSMTSRRRPEALLPTRKVTKCASDRQPVRERCWACAEGNAQNRRCRADRGCDLCKSSEFDASDAPTARRSGSARTGLPFDRLSSGSSSASLWLKGLSVGQRFRGAAGTCLSLPYLLDINPMDAYLVGAPSPSRAMFASSPSAARLPSPMRLAMSAASFVHLVNCHRNSRHRNSHRNSRNSVVNCHRNSVTVIPHRNSVILSP